MRHIFQIPCICLRHKEFFLRFAMMASFVLLSLLGSSSGFLYNAPLRPSFQLHSSTTPLMDMPTIAGAKERLIETATRLKQENSIFLVDIDAQEELQKAVKELEDISEPPFPEDVAAKFLGDWELVCTTTSAPNNFKVGNFDPKSLPNLFKDGPLKAVRDSVSERLNKYLVVQQRIRSETENYDTTTHASETVIDRVDHVLTYQPPDFLKDIIDNLPEQLTELSINPLHVSQGKLVLKHKAEIESTTPLKTKVSLSGIIRK